MKTKVLYIHPENEQELETIKNFCEAQNIKYEISKSEPYDPEFVAKIAESQEQYKNGEFISVEKKEIKGFLGLK